MGIVLISGESPSVSGDDHGRIIYKGLLLVLCCGDVWLLLLVMMMLRWLLRKLLDVVDVAVALDVPKGVL